MPFAASALLQFSGNITNFATISSSNSFKGWSAASAPCAGWTGILCDRSGRVTSLYAPFFLPKWICQKGIQPQLQPALHSICRCSPVTFQHCTCMLIGQLVYIVCAPCMHRWFLFYSILASFVGTYVSCIFCVFSYDLLQSQQSC